MWVVKFYNDGVVRGFRWYLECASNVRLFHLLMSFYNNIILSPSLSSISAQQMYNFFSLEINNNFFFK